MVTRYDIVVGIDPDCDKSGFSVVDVANRSISLNCYEFPELLERLQELKRDAEATGKRYKVVIEASWLIKTNWHLIRGDSKAVCAAKGHQVGRNHETGMKIAQMCGYYGIPYEEQRPLMKKWNTRDGKISHDELAYFAKLNKKRSNSEERDAALLAWSYANLPMKIMIIKAKR